jgi:cob(I)alamin adenosyltransferase
LVCPNYLPTLQSTYFLDQINRSMENDLSTSTDADTQLMRQIDQHVSHIWMVRTFLKHSDEATDDEELAEVHRDLYDFMLALGPAFDAGEASKYLHLARKKLSKLKAATETFCSIQPEVSGHMNYKMAAKSLRTAVDNVLSLLRPD